MAEPTPDVIRRYFAAQSARDFDALIGLFTDDAVVVDESKTWVGKDGVRAWRDKAASAYEYTTEVRGVKAIGESEFLAQVHLEGNFPGGVVDLNYLFTIQGNQIHRLVVE